MDIDTIRKDNLTKLMQSEFSGNAAKFVSALNKLSPSETAIGPNSIYRFFISGQNARKISSKFARRIEKAFDLSHGWMDTCTKKPQSTIMVDDIFAPQVKFIDVPIITYEQISMNRESIIEDPSTKYIKSTSNNPDTSYILIHQGESMVAPPGATDSFANGTELHIDKSLTHPKHQQFIIAKIDKTDNYAFRQYLISDGKPILHALNPSYPPILDNFTIIATLYRASKTYL